MKRQQRVEFNPLEIRFGSEAIVYPCSDIKSAKLLRRQHEEYLARLAGQFDKPKAVLRYPGGEVKVSAQMALASDNRSTSNMAVITGDSLKQVYTSPLAPVDAALYQVMGRMIESDRPMFLLDNSNDDQVWINQLACDMIQSSGQDAVRRCMRNYWERSDLSSLHQKLRDTSQPFEHHYRAILNDEQPDVWFEAVSRYEPIEINRRSFRLSCTQHFEIIGQSGLTTIA